jgi:MFS family permease
MQSNSFTSVLKNPGFLNLWVNQILVQLCYNSLNFALIIWVYKLTEVNLAVAGLLVAVYAPAVLFGLFAGVLVDITDRKWIILAIDFFLTVLFFLLIPAKNSYPAILLIAFLINSLSQFYSPAESSAIPMLAKKEQLLAANSIFSTTLYVCFLVGFSLAGPLIDSFKDINIIFILGGVILAVATVLALFFPSINARPDKEGRKLIEAFKRSDLKAIRHQTLSEIRQTLSLVRRRLAVLFAILIMGGAQAVIGVLAVLIPSFFEKVLHIRATNVSYVLAIPLGLGMVIGGLFLGKLGHRFAKRLIVSRGILIAGILFLTVGVAPIIIPATQYVYRHRLVNVPLPFTYQPPLSSILATGAFLLGIAMVSIIVPSQTVLQESTPEEDRGKVFAVLSVAMNGFSLIPVILVGVLADIFGAMPIFIGMGAVVFLLGLFGLKPEFFFEAHHLSDKVKQFLGAGHWEKS